MKKYKILHYDHFYKPGHDLKGCWIFDTHKEAQDFLAYLEEGKKKYAPHFDNSEYVLIEMECE